MDFYKEYGNFKRDKERVKKFTTSSRQNGRRTFPLFNTNLKTLSTVCSYIKSMYEISSQLTAQIDSDAIHQKNAVIQEFGFRSTRNAKDSRAITRSEIILAAEREYREFDNAFVTFLTYVLLLDIGGNNPHIVSEKAEEILRQIPAYIRRGIFEYVKDIYTTQAVAANNIYQQIVIYYGDDNLFQDYIQYIKENAFDPAVVCKLFQDEIKDPSSPISRRIKGYQLSSLKKEGYYLAIYHIIAEYIKERKLYGLRTGKRVVSGETFMDELVDYFDNFCGGSISWLGKTNKGQTFDDLKRFMKHSLTKKQQEEIYRCFANTFDLREPEKEE